MNLTFDGEIDYEKQSSIKAYEIKNKIKEVAEAKAIPILEGDSQVAVLEKIKNATPVEPPEPEYEPNADMVWAKEICANDVQEGFEHKVLALYHDPGTKVNLVVPKDGMVKTSDGTIFTYDSSMGDNPIRYTWDPNKGITGQHYKDYKLRWAIFYFSEQEATNGIDFRGYNHKEGIVYICLNNAFFKQLNSFNFLEYFDIINEAGLSSNISHISNMFYGCKSLKTIPLLDTSNITSFYQAFVNCKSLQSIPKLNTSKGTDFNGMFHNCENLKTIPLLDTSQGTDFSYTFANCKSLKTIPPLNLSKGTNFNYIFENCKALKVIPQLNIPQGIKFECMFKDCYNLVSIDLSNIASSVVLPNVSFRAMFQGCKALQSISALDTSKVINFDSMFSYCENLKTIPQLDTSQGTNFYNMFYYCEALQSVPELDTSKGTNFDSMFGNCKSLKTIPQLNTSKGTTFNGMFDGCENLKTIPQLDTSQGTNFYNIISRNYSLCNIEGIDLKFCPANTNLAGYSSLYLIQKCNLLNIAISLDLSTTLILIDRETIIDGILNNLVDLTGQPQQTLRMNSMSLGVLTDEDKAIATNKNWIIQ